MRPILLSIATLGATALLSAQGFQCTLLGTFNNHGPFNDVWGFVGSNGKEYALLLATTGTIVVDCSNPANPIERGWFPWQNSTWRDARYYQGYAYITTESSGGGGFQVLDLTNPDAPSLVGVFTGGGLTRSHNICIDTATGRLYLPGANTGTPAFDITNPASPVYLGLAAGTGDYNHDLCVENGYGYCSMINDGLLRIWDMATFPPTILSNSSTPSRFTHNAWPNAAGTVCVTTDERAGGLVRFYDITNKSAPRPLSQIGPGDGPASGTIPHNAFLLGDHCHVAWYGEGYQCFDIKDPSTPIKVAGWDTNAGVTGYVGAWGCYPFQPSGRIYISDRDNGLFILRPHLTDLTIAHTALGDQNDELAPYPVVATVTTSNTLQSVTLRWRVGNSGAFNAVAMTPTGNPDEYSAAIPAHDAPTPIEYHVDAVDNEAARRSPRVGEYRFLVGTEVTRWLDDFETPSGWTSGGTGNDWQYGQTWGRAAASATNLGYWDPPVAYSGSNVRGTDLGPTIGSTSYNGGYDPAANSWLQSPPIPTNGVQGLYLGYRRHLSLAAGDQVRVTVNGQVVWSTSARTDDRSWFAAEHDIAAIANGAGSLTVRFELVSNNTDLAGGWTLDDVRLFTRHDCVAPVAYGAGTPGTGGLLPTLAMSGAPVLGGTPVLQGAVMFANSAALLGLNFLDADLPVLGVQLLVDPAGIALLAAPIDAAGNASWPLGLPANPSLDDVYLYAQAFPLDPGAPGGLLSASHGLRFRICASAP